MLFKNRVVLTLLAASMLVLSACAPGESGVPVTGETVVPTESTSSPVLPPEAVLTAQQWLASQLNTAADQIRIVEVEQAEWTDSCLGLGRLDESCLQAITPGWRVVFESNGVTYEVRTDETASAVRLAPSSGTEENSLENTHWRLVSFGDLGSEQGPVEGSLVTLILANGQAGGYGGCNSYGGTYQVEGDSITFDEMVRTERACEDERITEQENRYFQALESVARFERSDNLLVLSDADGNGLLVFETPLSIQPGFVPGTSYP
ncbi:MAG TPA: META domain-containing protein [Anaerolineales bacterium]|nr:META domain-containing protein [Anaerolineales bacterium]